MVSLGSRAVEEVVLGTKMTGASHDLQSATNLALTYCSWCLGWARQLLVDADLMGGMPMPSAKMADALLDDLMEETKRLIEEKRYAVEAVADAFIRKGELIGIELDEVFEAADAAHPELAGPFERKIITLPRLFASPTTGGQDWPTADVETPAAFGQPGFGGAAGRPASDRPAPGTPGWPGTLGDAGDAGGSAGHAGRSAGCGLADRSGLVRPRFGRRAKAPGAPRGPSRAGPWRISGPTP